MKDEIVEQLASLSDPSALPVMSFTRKEYSTFVVEYATDHTDLVFHFYPLATYPKKNFWSELFPQALSDVAQEYFKATFPRLKAALTQELGINSWWFRANGFADSLDPDALISGFFQKLDAHLTDALTKG